MIFDGIKTRLITHPVLHLPIAGGQCIVIPAAGIQEVFFDRCKEDSPIVLNMPARPSPLHGKIIMSLN